MLNQVPDDDDIELLAQIERLGDIGGQHAKAAFCKLLHLLVQIIDAKDVGGDLDDGAVLPALDVDILDVVIDAADVEDGFAAAILPRDFETRNGLVNVCS